jgi:ATP-binding cassette subfamily A (ABC1) protein 2
MYSLFSLQYGKILTYSNPFLVWLFLMLFAIATIVFCFLISVFFSKAKLAAACGGIIYFLTYMPFVFISIREDAAKVRLSGLTKSFASLFSTTAFGLASRYFALYEEQSIGIQWSNIGQSPVS